MPKSRVSLYAPFLLVALVQALFVALYPSTGTDRAVSASGFDSQFGPAPTVGDGTDFAAPTPGGPPVTDPSGAVVTTVPATPGSPSATTPGGAPAPTTPDSPNQPGDPGAPVVAGDTSHCVGDRQMAIFAVDFENPVCKPTFVGDNGGATWTGVTGDSIRIVIIEPIPNEAVDAVLRSQGLASTREEREAVRVAAEGFVNKYYETYGRKVVFERFEADCPTSPQDPPPCIADVRKVIETQPFAVFFAQPSYPELFEEFTRAGIISIGGWHFSKPLFTERRPFRWDIFVDGTDSADLMGEYYCKKLVGKNASHSGATIHPLIGTRGNVLRKLGIVVPDSPAYLPDADVVKRAVEGCGGVANVFAYTQDINSAQNEANGLTSALVNDGVTTVLCMCDPVFPAFLTSSHSAAGYFPEHMLAGTGLLDADTVGRLYTREQWIHAFGPSHLADTRPFSDEQVSRVFADQGMGTPCNSCNLHWVYYSLLASMVHNAGPTLNPGTVEAGLFALPSTRGGGEIIGLGYKPGDYSAIDDVREAYWVPTAVSKVDGQRGSYRSVDGGRRYAKGEFTTDFKVPVEPSQG